jgi:hypothetical protein
MGISGIQAQVALALVQGTRGGGQPGQTVAASNSPPGALVLALVRVALEA